ncbi:MAG TPA: maleylpyruvate isomerase family mycothiol-dependent enzyme [Acidimicrobiales bacterium]|nr:maleylpyruvate isomerase family mycothiol-dependent enzyme [Acidimicrobiales bacterium]
MASDGVDMLRELDFALAEADSLSVGDRTRSRVLGDALAARAPGPSSLGLPRISGAEAFRRAAHQLDELLGELGADEWQRPALRDLDVQGLVGHLIGVEQAFADAVEGIDDAVAEADHVSSTQPAAERQRGVDPTETLAAWRHTVERSLRAVDGADPDADAPMFYGISLPLDLLLVVRAFEVWVHHEDVRRATGRLPAAPDDCVLYRMTELAVELLPVGLARAGLVTDGDDRCLRMVLTGAGGGTWLVPLDGSPARHPAASGSAAPDSGASASAVIETVDFCRVVGNRVDPLSPLTRLAGDETLLRGLLVGAASLALD